MTGRSKRKLHSNISIKQVAQSLNVSAATVSRALSRPELLNKETRVRILEAVEHMGYRPNLIARGLRLKKTQLLFVVVPTLSPFFLEVFRGVERAARETNYSVLMGHTNREISRELIFIDQALAQRPTGSYWLPAQARMNLLTAKAACRRWWRRLKRSAACRFLLRGWITAKAPWMRPTISSRSAIAASPTLVAPTCRPLRNVAARASRRR